MPPALSTAQSGAPHPGRLRLRAPRPELVGTWLLVAAALSLAGAVAAGVAHPHLPDRALLAVQPLATQLHLGAALGALVIGIFLMTGRKGRALHRTLGWTWVALMAVVTASSFFIHEANPGGFSFIHLISGWVAISLPMGVILARRGDVAAHRAKMTGLFVYGLLVAGALTFLPGRLMWRLFLG